MRLEALYRLEFRYVKSWTVQLDDDVHQLLHGEGRCEGRVAGRFHGTNRARRRAGAFEPDYDGVIECDDGAVLLWHLSGFGQPHRGRVVATVKHLTEDERYAFLNETLCVASGAIVGDDDGTRVTLDVDELVWEPPTSTQRLP
jgi:hypothetical protein